jgi:hypothetical protein
VVESIIASSEKSEQSLLVVSMSRRSSREHHQAMFSSKVEVNGISGRDAFLMISATHQKIAAGDPGSNMTPDHVGTRVTSYR